MSSNPTLDRFWREFHAFEPAAELGGIDANKPGYHERRVDLPASDYSVGQVSADRRGRGTVASAIDLTMWPAGGTKMRLYTNRLKSAALNRDPRLWLRGGPTLREFIGTDDGQRVYCYVFTGGGPLGVGADSGPDWGRSDTHLWHIHLSIIRQFAEDWGALDAVLSVLRGESLAAWRARTEEGPFMALSERDQETLIWRIEAIVAGRDTVGGGPTQGESVVVNRRVAALAASLAQGNAVLRNKLDEIDQEATDRAAAVVERDAAATAERAELRQLLAELDSGTLTQDELVGRLRIQVEAVAPTESA